PARHAEGAAVAAADVLTEHEHALVVLHLFDQRLAHRFVVGHALGCRRSRRWRRAVAAHRVDPLPVLLGLRPGGARRGLVGARYLLRGFAAQSLDVGGAHDAFGDQARGVERDRIGGFPAQALVVVLVAGNTRRGAAVETVVVVVRVPGPPVGDELDERRAMPGPSALRGPGAGGGDLVGVVAEDRDAGNAVAHAAQGEAARRRLLAGVRAERPAVVLDHENQVELLHAAEVHRLVPLPEARGAVADAGEPDAIFAA